MDIGLMPVPDIGIEVGRFLRASRTRWGTSTVEEFRPLSTFDMESMKVAARMDWTQVDLEFPARTRRGYVYMRTYYPRWLERIDANDLDVAGSTRCVLGQMYGHYGESLEMRIYGGAWLQAHGFVGLSGEPNDYALDTVRLTNYWRGVITRDRMGVRR